ncbi:hypothetical protein LB572_23610 [Mesorhizobium sp. BH1-1-5]|uniref:hypothetical protein n=1 Tax=Mesorhizobium sp. BH1-1-5 TaxID=2876661 RepID=UPI001CCE82E9|nr:hypothetical protein [Mesorhizobium sp. BH1-1-5]MBZ9990092.1 hypothetical protein [Mesorhizobium sp. BH1-1-5]
MTNFKRITLAAALVVSAFGSVSAPASAGILPSNDGAVCKGHGACVVLQLNCKGKYVDGTDSSGTVYGKCRPATAQVDPKSQIKLAK